MPGKPKHSKKKHSHLSRKSRTKMRHDNVALPPVAIETPQPAVTLSMPPSSRKPVPPTTSSIAQYPYITAELRSIGILAGIILVILIVLALVLS